MRNPQKRVADENYFKKDFWIQQNLLYSKPNFRARKCARLVNQMSQGRPRDLLDIGCGPAALRDLLDPNIRYFGIDIALHEPAPYLLELDFAQNPISFHNRRFDFIVALGVFEFMGQNQSRKFAEIRDILKGDGKLIVSYINFNFFRTRVSPYYNNIQSVAEMKENLERVFQVVRCFPASHHWRFRQPGKYAFPAIQMRLNRSIPLISSWLALEYFFVCSRLTQTPILGHS